MRKLLIALCAVALLMTACQKEPSYEDPNSNPGGGNTQGTKLVRLATHIGDDSVTLDYSYNGFDRIVRLTSSGAVLGIPVEIQLFVNRDAANVITSTVIKSPFLIPSGYETDSIVRNYEFDRTTNRYIRAVQHYVVDDEPQSDSAVFNYDASGKLTSGVSYYGDVIGYEPDTKVEYTYAGNNIASIKEYEWNGSDFVLITTETYEFDTKVNPQQSVQDAPVLGMLDFYSANNPVKRTTVDHDLGETSITTVSYTYNAANRPIQSVGSDGTSTSTISYYYQ